MLFKITLSRFMCQNLSIDQAINEYYLTKLKGALFIFLESENNVIISDQVENLKI